MRDRAGAGQHIALTMWQPNIYTTNIIHRGKTVIIKRNFMRAPQVKPTTEFLKAIQSLKLFFLLHIGIFIYVDQISHFSIFNYIYVCIFIILRVPLNRNRIVSIFF